MSLFDPADIDEVLEAFNDAGLATVLERNSIPVPGAQLQLVDVDHVNLDGVTFSAQLVLVAGDGDHRQVLEVLFGLLETADPVLGALGGATGPARFVTVLTPEGPLPGLSVPFQFDTE